MRTSWLALVTLLLTVGCTREGKLRPQVGAVPLSEDGNAAVTGEYGVRLVAHGSSWKGRPADIERHFTLVEIRLENDSGRPLSIRHERFELEARERYVARNPQALGRIMSARSTQRQPPRPASIMQPRASNRPPPSPTNDNGGTDFTRGTIPAYKPPPCYTCPSSSAAETVPSADMLRLAFQEGPLEAGQARDGFLYFEEPLLLAEHATLKVTLVDASTGELFGTLSVPFEVH